jgi:hypothetical protein
MPAGDGTIIKSVTGRAPLEKVVTEFPAAALRPGKDPPFRRRHPFVPLHQHRSALPGGFGRSLDDKKLGFAALRDFDFIKPDIQQVK